MKKIMNYGKYSALIIWFLSIVLYYICQIADFKSPIWHMWITVTFGLIFCILKTVEWLMAYREKDSK